MKCFAYIHVKRRDGSLFKDYQLLFLHTKEVVLSEKKKNSEPNSENMYFFREKIPKELLGWPFCVLTSHDVHRDQTIFASKSVS